MARPRKNAPMTQESVPAPEVPVEEIGVPAQPESPAVALDASAVAATAPEALAITPDAPKTPQAPAAPKFKEFIREHEAAAQALGVVVVKITHPDASGDLYQGTYSGISTLEGDPAAVYSDGSKH